ncbi:DUF4426 domain-containing protein [Alteromonas sediminis]|uniref:DUF4426 domain-containing protein n=1 Tax=Alteromonas sediminis TaxID=2259342 RepID=A0A3N5Y494_9ALTE|nr:DUF4426 domain-containing protein [Alteromonas sediminis]RPJ67913.1 DUF4426 domain-containing protein [Alteromonas sediminis]
MKRFLLVLITLFSCTSVTYAEQKKVVGPWDVHYMVVNTTFLTPEIAKANGIVRSKYNALVNISVLDTDDKKAQLVAIDGEATNLLGNKKKLSFKRVQEGQAIYYLAVVPFRDKETLRFDISLRQGNTNDSLKFQQKMTVD